LKIQVEELKTAELIHDASTEERIILESIGAFIYKHKSPAGTITIQVIQASVVIGSVTFTSAQMESDITAVTATNVFHGPYRLTFAAPLVLNRGTFQIKMISSGYTFSESAYFGWIREHERVVNNFTSTGNTRNNPLAIELWERARI